MKKALYILIGIISMIVGVSGVKGTTRVEFESGKCVLIEEKNNLTACHYVCNVGPGKISSTNDCYGNDDNKLDIIRDEEAKEFYLKIFPDDQRLKSVFYKDSEFKNKYGYVGDINYSRWSINYNDSMWMINSWIKNNNFMCHTDISIKFEWENDYELERGYCYSNSKPEYIWNLTINDIFVDDEKPVVNNECGMIGPKDGELVKILRQIYMYIKIIIPVLIIGLGIADLLKSLGTGKDDDLKKAINKFAKRIILAIVFILVPIIISILINISGVTSQYDKINDGIKSLFCIIE